MTNIVIPEDINALALPIQERIALATIRNRPTISNGLLARCLGLSVSGARAMLRRFKKQGLLIELGVEGSRQLRLKVGGDEGCQIVSRSGTVVNRQKVTPPDQAALTPEQRAEAAIQNAYGILCFIDEQIAESPHKAQVEFYAWKLTQAIEQIEQDVPEPQRSGWLKLLEPRRNVFAAVSYAIQQNLSPKQARQIDKVLSQATQEQLADLYEKIQTARQLGAGSTNRPLLFDVAPSQEP